MPFKPKALVNTLVCRHCKGSGCNYCQDQGVYAEMEGQRLIFNAPLFMAVGERKKQKKLFIFKRLTLYTVIFTAVILLWKYLIF